MRQFDIPRRTYERGVDFFKKLSKKSKLFVFASFLVVVLGIAGTTDYLQARAFSGGSGTIEDPFLITTCVELEDMGTSNNNLRADYLITNDIDCSGIPNFTPIGDMNIAWYQYAKIFRGKLDGGGHTISNLTINYPSNIFVGMIAQSDGAVIKNIKIQNANVTGSGAIGAVIGEATRSSIVGISIASSTVSTDTTTSGSVGALAGIVGNRGGVYQISVTNTLVSNLSSTDDSSPRATGGIIGFLGGSVIGNSYSNATTTSTTWPVGGIVGSVGNGTVINTYTTGRTTGSTKIGGIVGTTDQAIIQSSYFNGIATTSQWAYVAEIGGIVGADTSQFFAPTVSIKNTFAVGLVSSTTESGGMIGGNLGGNTGTAGISNNYYYPAGTTRTACSGVGTVFNSSECTSDNTSAHYNSNTFAPESSWDFVHMWQNVASNRPSLRLLPYTAPSSPISIGSCAALVSAILTNPDGWYALSSNIDCAGDPNLIPITYYRPDAYFTGTLDGNSHTINGVTISTTTTTNNIGLFGTLAGAYIKNLFLAGGGITAKYSQRVGALAGEGFGSSLYRIFSSLDVAGGNPSVGGIVGENARYIGSSHASGNISSSYNGTASDGTYAGGIIGSSAQRLLLENSSYASGTVGAIWNSGTLVGTMIGDIRNSSSSGTLFVGDTSGGLVGVMGDSYSQSSISDSSFSGIITGDPSLEDYSTEIGGIVGQLESTDLINVSSAATITFPNSNGLEYSGGMVGYMSDSINYTSNIRNSSFTGSISVGTAITANGGVYQIGGIIGYGSYGGEVTDTFASTTMTFGNMAHPMSGGGTNIGGLFGDFRGGSVSTSTFTGSITLIGNTASASVGEFGGVVGNDRNTPYSNTHASSTITVIAQEIYDTGGFGGTVRGDINTSHASSTLLLTAANDSFDIGGFAGAALGTIRNSYASTRIIDSAPRLYSIGGLVGDFEGTLITTSYATDPLVLFSGQDGTSQVNQIGGFIGYTNAGATFQNIYSSSTVSISSSRSSGVGAYQVGGLFGLLDAGTIVTNGYSSGAVTFTSTTTAISDRIGGAIGEASDAFGANTLTNLFSASPVSAGAGATNVGAFIGAYGITDFLANIAYDTFRTTQALCTGTDLTDPSWCTVKNAGNSTPTYFYSHLNDPQSSWDFVNVWLEHPNTYPTFGMSLFVAIPPSVTTSSSVTSITSSGALLSGNMTSTGTGVVTQEGFVYGATSAYTATSSSFSGSFSSGAFTKTLSSLTPSTTYHFAAYALSSDGVGYGTDQTFTTGAPVASGGGSGGRTDRPHDIVLPATSTPPVTPVTTTPNIPTETPP